MSFARPHIFNALARRNGGVTAAFIEGSIAEAGRDEYSVLCAECKVEFVNVPVPDWSRPVLCPMCQVTWVSVTLAAAKTRIAERDAARADADRLAEFAWHLDECSWFVAKNCSCGYIDARSMHDAEVARR